MRRYRAFQFLLPYSEQVYAYSFREDSVSHLALVLHEVRQVCSSGSDIGCSVVEDQPISLSYWRCYALDPRDITAEAFTELSLASAVY